MPEVEKVGNPASHIGVQLVEEIEDPEVENSHQPVPDIIVDLTKRKNNEEIEPNGRDERKGNKRKNDGELTVSRKTQNIHRQKKLKRKDLPWLKIPSEDMLEANTWEPSWKEVGLGDANHFFGIQEELKIETTSPKNLSAKEAPTFAQDWIVGCYEKWEKCNKVAKLGSFDTNAMGSYVEKRFLEWNWSSHEQHQKDLQWYREIMTSGLQEAKSACQKEIINLYYTELLKAMKKERRHFRREFENDYLLNKVMFVTGLKYLRSDKKFVARVQYSDDKGDGVKKHIPVSEEWVKKEAGFANDGINHVLHLDSGKGYFPIPADMQLKVENQKITRVKYVPEQKRNILEIDEVLKSAETREEDLPLKRSPSKMKQKRNSTKRNNGSCTL